MPLAENGFTCNRNVAQALRQQQSVAALAALAVGESDKLDFLPVRRRDLATRLAAGQHSNAMVGPGTNNQ